MTFDSTAYSFSAGTGTETPPPYSSRRAIAHVEIPSYNDNSRDVNQDSHQDENRDDGAEISIVETHIGNAQSHFDDDNIEGAVEELIAAAERLRDHKNLVHESMNRAIGYLTTMGCRATPPHPKAISLVKIRKTLPT